MEKNIEMENVEENNNIFNNQYARNMQTEGLYDAMEGKKPKYPQDENYMKAYLSFRR
jgi:hypothetical protein